MTTLDHAEARRHPRSRCGDAARTAAEPCLDNWWRYLVGILAILFALFPVVYVVSAAFNPIPSLQARS